jgi:competence protein ComEC
LRVAVISSLLAVIFSYLYFDLWFKAYDRYEGEVTATGTVQSFDTSSYKATVHIKTTDINETAFSEYNLIVFLDKNEYYGYSVGSEVKIKGVIESVSNSSDFDAESYYNAKGISGFINEVTYFEITDTGEYPLSYKIQDFRMTVCRKIIYTSNEEVGGLLCALLLGEKEFLPIGTKLDFSRIGISHILALSGMHLAILTVGLTKLLRFFGVGKKTATVCGIIFTVFYMIITGFSVSVTRAGFMLIISSLLFLFSRTKDSLTSLFLAVTAICIVEPYSIFDTSLWLSAFATLGIVVFGEYISTRYSKPSFFKWIAISLLSSFFAIAATFAITTLKFDGISLVAPITTLLFSLLIEVFIYIGLLLVLLGSYLPIKRLLIPIGDFILYASDTVSDVKSIYVSTNFAIVKIFAVAFATMFFAFFIMNIKHKRTVICSMVFVLAGIFVTAKIMTYSSENTEQICYFADTDERIVVSDDGEIALIDISNYKKKTAYSSYAQATHCNLTRIDNYIFTHYSYYIGETVEVLLDSILIDTIYLPTPQDKTEERIMFEVANLADSANTKIEIYQSEDFIEIGNTAIFPLHNSKLGSSKKNMITILRDEKFYTYLNVNMFRGETKNMALEVMDGSHTIILGRHGDGSYNYKFTHKLDNAENIVISSERIILHEEILKLYFDKIRNDVSAPINLYVE